jgi:CRP/FNR family cyclic AMP-dependent transcriptional regulator
MRPVAFARGELVFRQGDRGQHLVVLESGELEALLAVPGREPLRLSSLHPGDVVGELALLGDGHRMATVRAVERSTEWALARVVFDDLRPAASAATGAIGRLAVKRLSELYRHCASELNGEPMFAPPGSRRRAPRRRPSPRILSTC